MLFMLIVAMMMMINCFVRPLKVVTLSNHHNYSRLSLSRTFKGPGDLFEIEKVRDIKNLTK